jgi:UDP-3-O-[3-hydroxymyristoyl] glucosamine N-acyltransferase
MSFPISFTAAQIADQLHGEVIGDGSVRLTGFAPADNAKPGDLTFAEKPAYFAVAEQSAATAVLVSHSSAVIDPSAHIDHTAQIGPHCVVGPGVKIGARSVLLGGNHIGRDCQIGEDVCLYPNVVIYARSQIGHRVTIHASSVIGSDGYGYVLDEGRQRKMLQVGNVIIHDDVEIGANAAIDRATLGSTVIGQGTKIDNLVHIGHNVIIGRNCIIMGQAGFAGSTSLGDYCVIAAQAGISGHLKLGNQAMVGAKSGVMRDVPDGGRVLWTPAGPEKETKRQIVAVTQLPELIRRVRALEKQVAELSGPKD